jgi:hypothetical protein
MMPPRDPGAVERSWKLTRLSSSAILALSWRSRCAGWVYGAFWHLR